MSEQERKYRNMLLESFATLNSMLDIGSHKPNQPITDNTHEIHTVIRRQSDGATSFLTNLPEGGCPDPMRRCKTLMDELAQRDTDAGWTTTEITRH